MKKSMLRGKLWKVMLAKRDTSAPTRLVEDQGVTSCQLDLGAPDPCTAEAVLRAQESEEIQKREVALCAEHAMACGYALLPSLDGALPVLTRVTMKMARTLRANGAETRRVEFGRWRGFHVVRASTMRVWNLRARLVAQVNAEVQMAFVKVGTTQTIGVYQAHPVDFVLWPDALARADKDPAWARALEAAFALGGDEGVIGLLPRREQRATVEG